jgi:sensor histidine kinase regulating citrate/malate metabolism
MKTAKLTEAKKFAKEIVLIRCHAIMLKDEHGQVIYTFESKKKADEFYKELTKKSCPRLIS